MGLFAIFHLTPRWFEFVETALSATDPDDHPGGKLHSRRGTRRRYQPGTVEQAAKGSQQDRGESAPDRVRETSGRRVLHSAALGSE